MMLGFVVGLLLTKIGTSAGQAISHPLALIAALLVPFLAGLYEDLTKSFGATLRLIATFVAAAIAFHFCGAAMVRFDMPLLDTMLASFVLAPLLLTMFCVGGIAHAFNLSDGLNGLLAGMTLLACGVLGYAARMYGDTHVYFAVLALIGATVGFLLFNFPRARLFAGDSGAYFLGTAVALFAILLIARNPTANPWLAFVAVLYPFADTTFAIVRRLVTRRPIMQPDAEHLHSLLVRRLAARGLRKAHYLSTLILVATTGLFSVSALFYAESTFALVLICIAYAATYTIAWLACIESRDTSITKTI
jgi:UDP-GlcNAc:undecaprenyl-phosphate/decaprenyl-phosphate GlcNAc-1-phosphate transferase